MEADGVDEKHETEDVDVLGKGEARVEGADGDADEEHGHDTELEAGDLDAPDKIAEADHGEEQEERVPREQVDHRAHDLLILGLFSYKGRPSFGPAGGTISTDGRGARSGFGPSAIP